MYTYTKSYFDILSGGLKADIRRSCGKTNVSLLALWVPTILSLQTALKTKVKELRIGQTLTILQPDGTLTLYNVLK